MKAHGSRRLGVLRGQGVIVGVKHSSGRRRDFSIEAVNQVGRFEGESRLGVLD